ncbi:3841_t:CDS:1, partial [Acaulospora colombiana]
VAFADDGGKYNPFNDFYSLLLTALVPLVSVVLEKKTGEEDSKMHWK